MFLFGGTRSQEKILWDSISNTLVRTHVSRSTCCFDDKTPKGGQTGLIRRKRQGSKKNSIHVWMFELKVVRFQEGPKNTETQIQSQRNVQSWRTSRNKTKLDEVNIKRTEHSPAEKTGSSKSVIFIIIEVIIRPVPQIYGLWLGWNDSKFHPQEFLQLFCKCLSFFLMASVLNFKFEAKVYFVRLPAWTSFCFR